MNKFFGVVIALSLATTVAAGDVEKGKAASITCAGCHGADGNSMLAMNPKLAGQSEMYIAKQLADFRSGARVNATMQSVAGLLTEENIGHVAAYYAAQQSKPMAVAKEFVEQGQSLYRGGDADRDIPACIACHGAKGEGLAAAGFPALSGQFPEYTKAQLIAFRSGQRNNDANNVMRDIVAKMSDEQIEALSQFVAGLH